MVIHKGNLTSELVCQIFCPFTFKEISVVWTGILKAWGGNAVWNSKGMGWFQL